jgi:hypothetical protein
MNNVHIANTEENILWIISNISQDALDQAFLNALMEHEAWQQAEDHHFWNFFLSKMRIISIILSSDEEYS